MTIIWDVSFELTIYITNSKNTLRIFHFFIKWKCSSQFYFLHLLFIDFSDENKYDLVNYWNATGLTGEEITALYQKTVDDQLAVLYIREQEKAGETIDAVKKVINLDNLRVIHFLLCSISCLSNLPFSFCGEMFLNITFYLMHCAWNYWLNHFI